MIILDGDYLDERWKDVSKRIKERDNYTCTSCKYSNRYFLDTHHLKYTGERIWKTPDHELTTLCSTCHAIVHRKNIEWDKSLKLYAINFFQHLFQFIEPVRDDVKIGKGQRSLIIPSYKKLPTTKDIFIYFAEYVKFDDVRQARLALRIDYPCDKAKQFVDHITIKTSAVEFVDFDLSQLWYIVDGFETKVHPKLEGLIFFYTTIECS